MISKYVEYQQAVSEELQAVFEGRQGLLYDVLRYHLGWVDQHGHPVPGGPKLHYQGALALAACEALSGDPAPSLPAGAGVELVHNFTLVHGEVQAGSAHATDRPSIWWVWGPSQAINAGDGLHALGRTTIMRLAQLGTPPERVLRAVQSLDRACLSLCEGQYLDLEFQDRLMVSSAAYLDMIDRKAGALAGCAAESGALASGAPGDTCSIFHEMGRKLGAAWQIARDIDDLWGEHDDGVTASNILSKKKSLPLIHTLEQAGVGVKRELGSIYMKRVLEPDDARRLIEVLDDSGARPASEAKAAELVAEALNAVGDSVGAEGSRLLGELGEWALQGGR